MKTTTTTVGSETNENRREGQVDDKGKTRSPKPRKKRKARVLFGLSWHGTTATALNKTNEPT